MVNIEVILCTLTTLVAVSQSFNDESSKTLCYSELGCFPTSYPWFSVLRPLPAPLSPSQIDTKIYYYSRNSYERFNITLWPSIALNGADFSRDRLVTAFITHGFAANGNQSWLSELKDNYLKRVDANVFLVDWGSGAQLLNYLQVASNTRVVGAEISRLMEWLISEKGLNATTVHLMGHSLGSHISAYVGKRVSNIGRITAFDPAQPGFEGLTKEVRLDIEDALFIDVLHTNSIPFIPLLGFGLMNPYGHVDFYFNGGSYQPGCQTPLSVALGISKAVNITNIKDLLHKTVEELIMWVGCSHGRSYEYFTAAIEVDCFIWGQKTNINVTQHIISMDSLEPFSLQDCTKYTCVPLGLETPLYPARGSFLVTTDEYKPFCYNNATEKQAVTKINEAVLGTRNALNTVENKGKEIKNSVGNNISKMFG